MTVDRDRMENDLVYFIEVMHGPERAKWAKNQQKRHIDTFGWALKFMQDYEKKRE